MSNHGKKKRSEMDAMNDPEFALEIALGPPSPELKAQEKGSGIEYKKMYFDENVKYLFKSAHLSVDDYRIYNGKGGKMILHSHHPGKDPFDSLDPLGMATNHPPYNRKNNMMPTGEWNAHCDVTGSHGFPSFKIRPKSVSRHGRQYISSKDGHCFMNMSKQSKLKTMSVRTSLDVCAGDSSDPVYNVQTDLAARTVVVRNMKDEQVMFMQKSSKALVMNVATGHGSESIIEIAAGCDVTAMLAIVYGIKQVGESYMKDAVENYVLDPAKDQAMDSATGYVEQNFGALGKAAVKLTRDSSNNAAKAAREYQKFHKMFYS
uniref:Uncharacterized protein n=1 Tax=Rhodosorus marinus TaxID=101924 RepID=A0A7S3A0S0_9RHOD|mmetsp:Transcript_40341/g.160255  ORF Transcript_40341/g.160255 Transcript_40341/m.160255 type:complete len:318 (+) Transcript_40341:106-1059(+)|eukprot:CAMPEP_0113962210 /NCGR_PEP_ID=MMETSP0011_2-20120614/5780_1 /TAXON_ID=101924 /ORGANISM="Rhodosorus marinus" /LENGTH=317 /DNA_ID=CAMNT_0000974021 /DNA_START=24 /DNA_END=977 /DNA_ORIENTATION=+ /assembly_acc=CAM_ASM_000156